MLERPFANFSPSLTSALTRAEIITPDDGTDLTFETRAILVGSGGDVTGVMANGETITLPSLREGVLYPIALHRIHATDTTATQIVALA